LFEKFTEKAINVIVEAQNTAIYDHSDKVLAEHLLLALIKETKGFCAKIFKNYNITYERLSQEIYANLKIKETGMSSAIPFSEDFKRILKRTMDLTDESGNSTVHYEHLVLTAISDKKSGIPAYLENLGFDIAKSKPLIEKLVQRKVKKDLHPELDESREPEPNLEKVTASALFDNEISSKIFKCASAKREISGCEMLGTEQIISAVLENCNEDLLRILENFGITRDVFDRMIMQVQSRQAEYDGKPVIFTPVAGTVVNLALQTAKELGSSEILPEHIILGLLKTKKGMAYEVIKQLNINDDDLAHGIIKPIEKQMPETLTILRLAKQEARRIGRGVVGTEMFLLGIIGEATGVGAVVLKELEINIRDARIVVEKIVGCGNEYADKEIVFTKRAKRVLETAWEHAKKENKNKIESSDMLWAITTEPQSLAMQALENLGTDVVEIREGLKKHHSGS